MKKMVSFLMVLTLLMVMACGGGDDTKEPTTTPEPTQTETPTPTPQPTQTVTPEPTPTATAEPTVEPTPTVDTDSVEIVLADVMPNLLVAFAEVDGTWQGYSGPNAAVLNTVENGEVYYFFAALDTSLSTVVLSKGWNMQSSPLPTAPIAEVLDGYEEVIPIVIRPDVQAQQTYVYMSSAVDPLTSIPVGQTYTVVVVEPGDPRPNWSTTTR